MEQLKKFVGTSRPKYLKEVWTQGDDALEETHQKDIKSSGG